MKNRLQGRKDWVKKLVPCAVIIGAAGLFLYSFSNDIGKKEIEPVSRSAFALDTFITVTLYDSEDTEILDGCIKLCQDYEKLLSKTIETSEIYQLNHRDPSVRRIEVSPETAEVIEKGLYYSALSGGAFDITIEPASALWEFSGEESELPGEEELQEAIAKVGYEKVSVEGNEVVFQDSETTLDLGGIAKGYIADKMKEYLLERGVESAVIILGGNVLCVGERADGNPFQIGLREPFGDRNEQVAVLGIRDLSVVSSGVYERHFVKDGVNYHHILNPDTGWPYQNGLASVTIVSEDSADGDALSTVCFSLGLEPGLELADSLPDVWAYFITEDGEIHYSEGALELVAKQ